MLPHWIEMCDAQIERADKNKSTVRISTWEIGTGTFYHRFVSFEFRYFRNNQLSCLMPTRFRTFTLSVCFDLKSALHKIKIINGRPCRNDWCRLRRMPSPSRATYSKKFLAIFPDRKGLNSIYSELFPIFEDYGSPCNNNGLFWQNAKKTHPGEKEFS